MNWAKEKKSQKEKISIFDKLVISLLEEEEKERLSEGCEYWIDAIKHRLE